MFATVHSGLHSGLHFAHVCAVSIKH